VSWLQLGNFTLHDGRHSTFKIECDGLTDADVATAASLLSRLLPLYSAVEGVPRGGLRLARALALLAGVGPGADEAPLLICDDVWTTGRSVEALGAGREANVAVIFARGPTPPNVTALFTLDPRLWAA